MITENAKLRIALTILLSCLLVAGVVLWCFAYFWKGDSILDAEPEVRVEVKADDGVNIEVSSEPNYGISFLDGAWQEAYSITASWTAENYDFSFVDIAGYSWSAKYASTNLQGGCSYDGDKSSATDFGGDVWNSNGNEYYDYVSFGEFSGGASYTIFYDDPLVKGYDGDEDFYTPGDMATDTVKVDSLAAYVWEPFGTPIELTFTLWDYSGNDPLTATVRFDYMSYYTVDTFSFYSGEEYDKENSELLFTGEYDMTEGKFSITPCGSNKGENRDGKSQGSVNDTADYMTPSLLTAQNANTPALWYEATGSNYSVGTVCEKNYADETNNTWSIQMSYESKKYTDNSSPEEVSNMFRGAASWNDIASALFETEGLPEKTSGAINRKNLQNFDNSISGQESVSAMMTVDFCIDNESKLRFGLSFDEYGNLTVGLVDIEVSIDGVIFKGE